MGCGLRVVGAGGGGGLSLAHLILTTSFEGVAISPTSQMEKLRHRAFTHLVGGRAGAQTQETSHQRTRMRKRGYAGEGCWQGMAQVPVLLPRGAWTHVDWSVALRNSVFLLPQWVFLSLPTGGLYFFHSPISHLWKDPALGEWPSDTSPTPLLLCQQEGGGRQGGGLSWKPFQESKLLKKKKSKLFKSRQSRMCSGWTRISGGWGGCLGRMWWVKGSAPQVF